ncbi:hypothetical protein B0I35DRAFT_86727 [Stachybotrys elegans]|uniref:Uncharacterized protein n=1 Tax=Stachybotrys elegans TaxID=80388 RepID=A0A8K0SJM6_9HYPO|nr:hypothetical protein B0I35DRAFT_86727 [Stachybotrys elegans]
MHHYHSQAMVAAPLPRYSVHICWTLIISLSFSVSVPPPPPPPLPHGSGQKPPKQPRRRSGLVCTHDAARDCLRVVAPFVGTRGERQLWEDGGTPLFTGGRRWRDGGRGSWHCTTTSPDFGQPAPVKPTPAEPDTSCPSIRKHWRAIAGPFVVHRASPARSPHNPKGLDGPQITRVSSCSSTTYQTRLH